MKKTIFLLMAILCIARMMYAQNNFLDFDGSNDHVRLNAISFGPQYSIEAWVNVDNLSGYYEILGFCDDPNSLCTGVDYEVIYFRVNPGGTIDAGWSPSNFSARRIWATSTTAIVAGQWYHLAVTINTATNAILIYRDGILQPVTTNNSGSGSGIAIGTPAIGSNFLTNLSNSATSFNTIYNGRMDELRIWSVIRTQSELAASMNSELMGNEVNLSAYYRFNQGVCGGANAAETTLNDNSGNGHGGILTNFALNGCNSNWVCGGSACSYPDNNIAPSAPVPTLSQWGLIIFALLLLCTGAVAVWNARYGKAYAKA